MLAVHFHWSGEEINESNNNCENHDHSIRFINRDMSLYAGTLTSVYTTFCTLYYKIDVNFMLFATV